MRRPGVSTTRESNTPRRHWVPPAGRPPQGLCYQREVVGETGAADTFCADLVLAWFWLGCVFSMNALGWYLLSMCFELPSARLASQESAWYCGSHIDCGGVTTAAGWNQTWAGTKPGLKPNLGPSTGSILHPGAGGRTATITASFHH